MGRRDPDPRPPIEVVGSEPAISHTEQVAMGPPRPKRATSYALAGVAGAAVLLLGALALGRDGGGPTAPGERTEADDRDGSLPDGLPTATTEGGSPADGTDAVTVPPSGPVLGEPVGASLLVAGRGDRWTWMDLDTGERRAVSVEADDPFGVVPVRDGVVVLRAGRAWLHPLPDGDPTPLGAAYQLLSSGLDDRLWLVGQRPPPGQDTSATARLIDLSGVVTQEVPIPGAYARAGTSDGVVVTAGGRTYLGRASGLRPVAQGNTIGSSAGHVVVLACDDDAVCRSERHDLETGATLRYPPIADPFNENVTAVVAPDGRLAEVAFGSSKTISLYAADGHLLGATSAPSLRGNPVWLPGDLGLLAPTASGVRWFRMVDGELQLDPIPELESISDGVPYVIPR